MYACDADWWEIEQPQFNGLKVSWDEVGVITLQSDSSQHGLSDDPMRINAGGNSGFQACNLAVLLGAKRIVLLGFDMHSGENGKIHWHGPHPEGMKNPSHHNFSGWIARFTEAAQDFKDMGVEVINCTPGSAIRCFPMAKLEDVM